MNHDQSSSPKPEPPAGAEGDGLNLENQPVPAGSKWMARFKRFFPAPFLAAGLLFGGLFALGFPKPFCDDLYFIGAGLNLANGGDFSNPFLERSQFPEPHHYFGHPPMLSYAVAGWLKLFGISARSLMSFQMLTYLVICRAMLALFRRHHFPPLLEWLPPLAVAGAFLTFGYRAEGLAVALTLAGLAWIDCGNPGRGGIFFGFWLLFLGASTASRTTFFSASFALLALVILWRRKVSAATLGWTLGLALAAAFGVFLLMIQGHLVEFWNSYVFAAHGRIGGTRWEAIKHFLFHLQGVTFLPVELLWLAALPLLLRFRDRELSRMALFTVLPVFLLIYMRALGNGGIWFIYWALFVVVAAWSKELSPGRARILQMIFTGALLASNFRSLLVVTGLLSGAIKDGPPGPPALLAEARSLESAASHTVLLDQETARYVFDYRIPPGFLDWNYGTKYPGSLAIESPPHPGDLYLLGPINIQMLNEDQYLHLPQPRWKPLGSDRWSFDRFPQTVFLINPQDCTGLPGMPGHHDGGTPVVGLTE